MATPKFKTVTEAARSKKTSRQAIYKALNEKRLTELSVGSTRLVVLDKKFQDFAARPYQGKRKTEDK